MQKQKITSSFTLMLASILVLLSGCGQKNFFSAANMQPKPQLRHDPDQGVVKLQVPPGGGSASEEAYCFRCTVGTVGEEGKLYINGQPLGVTHFDNVMMGPSGNKLALHLARKDTHGFWVMATCDGTQHELFIPCKKRLPQVQTSTDAAPPTPTNPTPAAQAATSLEPEGSIPPEELEGPTTVTPPGLQFLPIPSPTPNPTPAAPAAEAQNPEGSIPPEEFEEPTLSLPSPRESLEGGTSHRSRRKGFFSPKERTQSSPPVLTFSSRSASFSEQYEKMFSATPEDSPDKSEDTPLKSPKERLEDAQRRSKTWPSLDALRKEAASSDEFDQSNKQSKKKKKRSKSANPPTSTKPCEERVQLKKQLPLLGKLTIQVVQDGKGRLIKGRDITLGEDGKIWIKFVAPQGQSATYHIKDARGELIGELKADKKNNAVLVHGFEADKKRKGEEIVIVWSVTMTLKSKQQTRTYHVSVPASK